MVYAVAAFSAWVFLGFKSIFFHTLASTWQLSLMLHCAQWYPVHALVLWAGQHVVTQDCFQLLILDCCLQAGLVHAQALADRGQTNTAEEVREFSEFRTLRYEIRSPIATCDNVCVVQLCTRRSSWSRH